MSGLTLTSGSRVAVIGGGPAGSFFSYHLLQMAHAAGTDLCLDIFEPRAFDVPGPQGCNMCGGIVSESLVHNLAADGIHLPAAVVQRGLESYTLHMDVGQIRIDTPRPEKGIAAVYRGAGPRGIRGAVLSGLDGFLLNLAAGKGAQVKRERIGGFATHDGRPQVLVRKTWQEYDLLAIAVGVNSATLKSIRGLGINYISPRTTRTFISEFYLGRENIGRYLGTSMHIFLLDIPRLEFAALIPKGDYVTMCMLGSEIDDAMIRSFLRSAEVREVFPKGLPLEGAACHCSPRINVLGAAKPYADRVIFLGDCAVTRLYKDGIGAAYRLAKSAAQAALIGISDRDFEKNYWPACRQVSRDNELGKTLFDVGGWMKQTRFARRAVLRMLAREQGKPETRRRMSIVLWDVFTGSAPYREIMLRMLHPAFVVRFIVNSLIALWGGKPQAESLVSSQQASRVRKARS